MVRQCRPTYSYCFYSTRIASIQGCVRYGTGILGTGMDVPNLPKCPVAVLTSYRTYRTVRYIGGVPNLPKFSVPVLMYRIYRSFRYRYWCRTEHTEISGAGINVVPKLPKFSVPVLMSYRTYPSLWYRYESLYRHRYRYRHTLEYIYRQYRRYIPPARYRRTLALRYIKLDINWWYMVHGTCTEQIRYWPRVPDEVYNWILF